MKICPVGAELFYVGRRTDMTKLVVAFRNCANVPNDRISSFGNLCASREVITDINEGE